MLRGIPKNSVPMIERLRRALLDLLATHRHDDTLPTNGRFLFYELEQLGLVFKKKLKGAARGSMPDADDVSDALTDLREKGEVLWSWIVDETRFSTIREEAERENLKTKIQN
jgi:hypothetical protein